MGDALSVAASAIGVGTATLQSIQILKRTIEDVKNAPTAIANLRSDLNALEPVIRQLEQNAQSSNAAQTKDFVGPALQNCDRACKSFHGQLDHWMRHSKTDKMFWLDRWKAGLFGGDRTQALRAQLGDCKATLTLALSTPRVYVTCFAFVLIMSRIAADKRTSIKQAQNEDNEDEKEDVIKPQQDALQRKIQRADKDHDALEQRFGELSVTINTQVINNNNQIDRDDDASRQELLLELQKQLMSKESLKKAFEESYAEMNRELTGARVSGTHAKGHGQAYAGFVGSSSKDFKGSLDVSDTTASDYGFAAAGVIHGVNFPTNK